MANKCKCGKEISAGELSGFNAPHICNAPPAEPVTPKCGDCGKSIGYHLDINPKTSIVADCPKFTPAAAKDADAGEPMVCDLFVNCGPSGDECDRCGVKYAEHPSRYEREYDEVMSRLKARIAYFVKDGEWLADAVTEFAIAERFAALAAAEQGRESAVEAAFNHVMRLLREQGFTEASYTNVIMDAYLRQLKEKQDAE